jgi:hypothetical protein
MRKLNTQDFLDSQRALDSVKYKSLDMNPYIELSVILTVCVEWNKSFDETQETLDRYTFLNQGKLNAHLAKVESNG